MTEEFKPRPDPTASETVKSAMKRQAQVTRAKKKLAEANAAPVSRANPIVADETYGALREDNRVVMRHTIALNIADFRANSDDVPIGRARVFSELRDATPPFFSVVIANFNGARTLPTCLESMRQQTFTDFEVIVADDASTDNALAIVEQQFPEVRVVVSRSNQGFAATCNTGAAASRGRFIVLLNNDTEADPQWLEQLAQTIVSHPEAASVASKLLLFGRRTVLHTAGDAMGIDGVARNRGAWQPDTGQFDQDTQIFSACGGAAAYRRDVWEALGGFDETFRMYLEDVDFGFRARLAGFESIFAPDARVYHHVSASGGDVLASYYVGRNSIWMLVKNMPESLLLRNLPRIITAQLMVTIDALRHIRGKAAQARLRGQWDGIRGIRAQLAKRTLIQQRRVVQDDVLQRALERE